MSGSAMLNFIASVNYEQLAGTVSDAFLKNVLVVAPGVGSGGSNANASTTISELRTKEQIEALFGSSAGIEQLIERGLSKIYGADLSDLSQLEAVLNNKANPSDFFTILLDGSYTTSEIQQLKIPSDWEGVIGLANESKDALKAFKDLEITNKNVYKCFYYGLAENAFANMYSSFGCLLASSNWRNHQYTLNPADDKVTALADYNAFFDDRTSFTGTDKEIGKALCFFVVMDTQGKDFPIVAPYIDKEILLTAQNSIVTWLTNAGSTSLAIKNGQNCKVLQAYVNGQITAKYNEIDPTLEGFSIAITPGDTVYTVDARASFATISAIWRTKITIIK